MWVWGGNLVLTAPPQQPINTQYNPQQVHADVAAHQSDFLKHLHV